MRQAATEPNVETHRIGIILNGVTGRMGMNQHLERSIMAIRRQGGLKAGSASCIMPEPILVGLYADIVKSVSQLLNWNTQNG